MDTRSPLFAVSDEQADKLVSQVLEIGDGCWSQAVELRLCHLLKGGREKGSMLHHQHFGHTFVPHTPLSAPQGRWSHRIGP